MLSSSDNKRELRALYHSRVPASVASRSIAGVSYSAAKTFYRKESERAWKEKPPYRYIFLNNYSHINREATIIPSYSNPELQYSLFKIEWRFRSYKLKEDTGAVMEKIVEEYNANKYTCEKKVDYYFQQFTEIMSLIGHGGS